MTRRVLYELVTELAYWRLRARHASRRVHRLYIRLRDWLYHLSVWLDSH